MSATRVNVVHMSKMIQIRNVPDDLHRRAEDAGRGGGDEHVRLHQAGARPADAQIDDSRRSSRGGKRAGGGRPAPSSRRSTSSAKRGATDGGRRRFGPGRVPQRRRDAGVALDERLEAEEHALWAPHLIDAEVGHALRRKVRLGQMDADARGGGPLGTERPAAAPGRARTPGPRSPGICATTSASTTRLYVALALMLDEAAAHLRRAAGAVRAVDAPDRGRSAQA